MKHYSLGISSDLEEDGGSVDDSVVTVSVQTIHGMRKLHTGTDQRRQFDKD